MVQDGRYVGMLDRVVQNAESRELIGLVSRSDLVNPSRTLFDEEHNYETSETTAVSSLMDVFRRR